MIDKSEPKSVIISIKPKWCDLIASGKKTIEIRKNRPKMETPFKCYIYCTHGYYRTPKEREMSGDFWIGKPINDVSPGRYLGNGKVIGEFVCQHIDKISHCGTSNNDIRLQIVDKCYNISDIRYEYLQNCRLAYSDLERYSSGGDIYGWHISDLKIYDKPKELSEFGLTRPPQSWCYPFPGQRTKKQL